MKFNNSYSNNFIIKFNEKNGKCKLCWNSVLYKLLCFLSVYSWYRKKDRKYIMIYFNYAIWGFITKAK